MPVKTRSSTKRSGKEQETSEIVGAKKRRKTSKRVKREPKQLEEESTTGGNTTQRATDEETGTQESLTRKGEMGEEETAPLREKSPHPTAEEKQEPSINSTTVGTPVEQTPTTVQAEEEVEAQELQVYERGHIHFFFRPKIDVDKVHQLSDVARLFFILEPTLGTDTTVPDEEEKKKHFNRLFIIGKKQLPDMEQKRGYWGVLEYLSSSYQEVKDQLKGGEYETATRGTRTLEAARPVAHGVYYLIRHQKLHTHLVYVLEIPETPQEVQQMFHIEKEGSYLIQVKNPEASASGTLFTSTTAEHQIPHLKEEMKAHYSKEVQQVFEHPAGGYQRRWASAYPIDLLNSKGAEILIIPVTEKVQQELGQVGEELEHEAALRKLPNIDQLIKELQDTQREFAKARQEIEQK